MCGQPTFTELLFGLYQCSLRLTYSLRPIFQSREARGLKRASHVLTGVVAVRLLTFVWFAHTWLLTVETTKTANSFMTLFYF
jgi:hypothetical protein